MPRYKGLLVQQVADGPEIVMFAAPVADIAMWAGIPQRRRIDQGIETAGFQREEKASRVNEIAKFMHEPANVIQNPLLAAVQDAACVTLTNRGDDGICEVEISAPVDRAPTLLELIEQVRGGLVKRLPELQDRPPNQDRVSRLRERMSHITTPTDGNDDADDNGENESPDFEASDDLASGLFQEETQVVDFFDELNARAALLRELGEQGEGLTEIAGFNREYLEGLIRPVVLVDGQHRLRGALSAIRDLEESSEGDQRISELIDSGLDPDQARYRFSVEAGRRLPVSLLTSSDPAEHVFQFVVVNQKATPMSNALLGTIVATSLTRDELEPIAQRLSNAGIQLESSRAVAFLSRAQESPFQGLVSTGVAGDRPKALPWSVLLRLANIIRNLSGGETYHAPKIDYARYWRRDLFDRTGLIPADVPDESRYEYWSEVDGPWRRLFITLHTRIKDKFGSDDENAHNYWGSTSSNLYNMVSLHILTVDFFKFLHDKDRALGNWDDLDRAIDDWIGPLNPEYFNRDFRMSGTKKDQPRIKAAWSEAWAEFRVSRRLPRVERYNPGGRQTGE